MASKADGTVIASKICSVLTAFRNQPKAALCVLAFLAPALLFIPVTHDEIWDLWIGRQMIHGARLYRDIIEVNPPLWFWISAALASSGLELRALAVAFFAGAMAVSLWLTPDRYRSLALAAILILPLHDFGQREVFTLIATVPYVFLIAQRAADEPVKHPIIIGTFAAIGLALKPYFILVPLVLELTVKKKRLRGENLAIASCALLYAVAVPLFAPEYLTTIVPMLYEVYGAFGGGPGTIWALLAFVSTAAGAWLGHRHGDSITRTLAIAALAFLPSTLIQAKGWPYQSVPARGLLFMAVTIELLRSRRGPIADGLMFGGAIICLFPLGFYTNDYIQEMDKHLVGVPRGSSIVVVANNPSAAWPAVYDHGLSWDLPEMSAWQIQALAMRPSVKPIAQHYVDIGLARHPDILVIDIRPDLATATQSLIPTGYLVRYRFKLRTKRLQSFVRIGDARAR